MPSELVRANVCDALRYLSGGEASDEARRLALHYGVSVATIHRWSGIRRRAERSDKGSSAVAREIVIKGGALMHASRRASTDIPIPACDAQEILADSGMAVDVSSSRYRQLLRDHHVSARDLNRPAPHTPMRSRHPNHVWQFDVTNCIQYFLDDGGSGLRERDADMTLYRNKIVKTAREIKRELLRYVAVDHCSGAFYFRYFYAEGERAEDGSEFLFEAFRPKEEAFKKFFGEDRPEAAAWRMHGVPFVLVADRGSITRARRNQALLECLRVELKPHLPGNPRAKGAVEGMMHYINRFEGRLRFRRPGSLDELNRWALDWSVMVNTTKKMRNIAPRADLWQRIQAHELRLCPGWDIYCALIREPERERTANGARIVRLCGNHYQIPDPNAAGQKVKVVMNPYEWPKAEVCFNGMVWLLEPVPMDDYGRLDAGAYYGEYRSPGHTDTQKAMVEMEKVSADEWGVKWHGTREKRRAEAPPVGHESPLKVFGHQAEKAGNLAYMDKRGVELEIKPSAPVENPVLVVDAAAYAPRAQRISRRIPVTEFFRRLAAATGPVSTETNARIRAQYGDSIDEAEAEELLAAGSSPAAACCYICEPSQAAQG